MVNADKSVDDEINKALALEGGSAAGPSDKLLELKQKMGIENRIVEEEIK